VEKVAAAGAMPVILGGDHSIAYPDAKGCANVIGAGRVSMLHFDAHADTGDIEFGSLWGHGQPMRRLIEWGAVRGDRFLQIGLRGYWPPPETLDWMASQQMRSFEMTEIVQRGLRDCLTEAFAIATDECDGVFLSVDSMCVIQDMHPAPAHRSRVVCPRANCWMRCGGFASSSPSSGWMWLRAARRTTMRTSLQHWRIEWSWRPSAPLLADVRICGTAPDGIRCNRSSASDQHRSRKAHFNTATLTSATIRRSEKTIMSDTRSLKAAQIARTL
jgi:Arginase family